MVKDWTDSAVHYAYDNRGLIERVTSPAGHTYYTYDARGAMLAKQLPNGTRTYHTYDAAGRVSKIEDRKSDDTVLLRFEFDRDANGNILSSLREDDSCWYYEYDGLQRLTKAEWKDSGGSTLYGYQYNYDKVGNRKSLIEDGNKVTCYICNEANELTRECRDGQEIEYEYDGRGNQVLQTFVGGHTTYYEYNSRDLITRIDSTEPGFVTNEFEYNALGQRTKKVDSTGTTKYVWDGLNILLETDASGTITKRYTVGHSPIEGISQLLGVEDVSAGEWSFLHFDQTGGLVGATDNAEASVASYAYDPNGRILAESGTPPTAFTSPGNYLRLPDQGNLRLSPTRIYDADQARFKERDPVRRMDGETPYAFAGGSLVNMTDPSGLFQSAELGLPAMDGSATITVILDGGSWSYSLSHGDSPPIFEDDVTDAAVGEKKTYSFNYNKLDRVKGRGELILRVYGECGLAEHRLLYSMTKKSWEREDNDWMVPTALVDGLRDLLSVGRSEMSGKYTIIEFTSYSPSAGIGALIASSGQSPAFTAPVGAAVWDTNIRVYASSHTFHEDSTTLLLGDPSSPFGSDKRMKKSTRTKIAVMGSGAPRGRLETRMGAFWKVTNDVTHEVANKWFVRSFGGGLLVSGQATTDKGLRDGQFVTIPNVFDFPLPGVPTHWSAPTATGGSGGAPAFGDMSLEQVISTFGP